MAKKKNEPTSREMLRNFRDRVVRLEEEKKAIADDIKDVYLEAKGQGFDVKALRKIVKDSMMDQSERAAQRETEAIVDLYRASLGMLEGTPLGDAARRKFEEDAQERAAKDKKDDDPDGAPAVDDAEANTEAEAASAEEARAQGKTDQEAGRSILQNPYAAGDPRRADWDEGWCEASGSDGMDVPEAWKRKSPGGGDQPGREA